MTAFRPIAEAKRIGLSCQIADTLPAIFADDDRLLQVISNLLTNALSLTPEGGSIELAVEPNGDLVRFVVVDSGPGISAEDLPRLFERYWRGNHGAYLGRGLGLAIARDLVEGHGGHIWADNQPTCGARISFTVRTAHSVESAR